MQHCPLPELTPDQPRNVEVNTHTHDWFHTPVLITLIGGEIAQMRGPGNQET